MGGGSHAAVAGADAVAEPRAVVVEHRDAAPAIVAVLAPPRLPHAAQLAEGAGAVDLLRHCAP